MSKKKVLLTLLIGLTAATIQAKPYTITAEDKACTNRAEDYNELADCFNDIANKALDHTEIQLKAKSKSLFNQFYKEAKKANQRCIKKYLVDDSPFSKAEKAQCSMDQTLKLGEKYDKLVK